MTRSGVSNEYGRFNSSILLANESKSYEIGPNSGEKPVRDLHDHFISAWYSRGKE